MTILLHGFWGQPADWNPVIGKLPLGVEVSAPDLYDAGPLSPRFELPDWATQFWTWVDENIGEGQVQIVGYSMGARLAVTAVAAQPKRVKRALALSGNPIVPQEASAERAVWEKEWTAKFLKLEWTELEVAWQDQGVFANTPSLPRRKTPEMREILGLSLERWSPRLHPFSFEQVKNLGTGVDYAFGALDQKYLEVAKGLQDLGVKGQISIIPNAGHRLITEAADFVADWIARDV